MRQFLFVKGDLRANIQVNVVDSNEKCTIMTMVGVKNTYFESIMPWQVGSVTSVTEIKEWFKKYQPAGIHCYYYNNGVAGEELNADAWKTLTINPTITGTEKVILLLTTINADNVKIVNEVELNGNNAVTVDVVAGYEYSFGLKGGHAIWTSGSAPDDVTISADTSVSVAITTTVLPNLTITSDTTVALAVDGTEEVKYTTESEGAVTITSSDDTVASVTDGVIKGLKAGTATITVAQAASGNYAADSKTIAVTVA